MDARTEAAVSDNAADTSVIEDGKDAILLDDLVEQSAEPPAPAERPVEPPNTAPAVIPDRGHDRINTTIVSVQTAWDTRQLIPADARRYELHIYAASDTATDYVLYADDASKLAFEMSCARLYSGQEIILSRYTGPVWVKAPDSATGPISVNATAVTK